MPPGIRSKSWQRASARLADLRKADYRSRFAEFRALGMTPAKASERSTAAIRDRHADLFARLLSEEYQLWLAVSGAAPPADGDGTAALKRAGMGAVTLGTQRGASGLGSPPEADDR